MLHIPTLAELEEQIRQLVENAPPSEIVCDKAYLEWAATLEDTTVEFV